MSYHTWLYIGAVLLGGGGVAGWAVLTGDATNLPWFTFTTLTVLATCAQLLKAVAPPNRHLSYSATLVFLFAGVLLLPPALFVPLVIIPHLLEWAKERWTGSANLRHWYVQPFNIAMHLIAGAGAAAVLAAFRPAPAFWATPWAFLAVVLAALAYALLNHLLLGQALVLARGLTWRHSGIL